jgi:hypothetical protein
VFNGVTNRNCEVQKKKWFNRKAMSWVLCTFEVSGKSGRGDQATGYADLTLREAEKIEA